MVAALTSSGGMSVVDDEGPDATATMLCGRSSFSEWRNWAREVAREGLEVKIEAEPSRRSLEAWVERMELRRWRWRVGKGGGTGAGMGSLGMVCRIGVLVCFGMDCPLGGLTGGIEGRSGKS